MRILITLHCTTLRITSKRKRAWDDKRELHINGRQEDPAGLRQYSLSLSEAGGRTSFL